MSMIAEEAPVFSATAVARESLIRKLLHDPLAISAAVVFLFIVATSVLAPLITPIDPNRSSLQDVFAVPSAEHPLGGDSSGRDVLARLLYAGRFSLLGAAIALAVAIAVGVPSGLLAGYYGKAIDTTTNWIASLTQALPAIMILLAVRAVVGPSMWVTMAVFGVLLSVAFYRVVRSAVSQIRNELYVDAARVTGLSDQRIIGRHVLFVVRAPLLIQAALVAGIAIALQSGLEFLGLGDLNIPSWGSMLNDAFDKIYLAPQLLLWPGLAIGLSTATLAIFANAVRDAIQGSPRTRRRSPQRVAAGSAATSTGSRSRPDNGALLDVADLHIAYAGARRSETEIVHSATLSIAAGEVLGLVGESGSGKTQTAFAVLGLLSDGGAVTGGRITFGGRDITHLPERDRARLRGRHIAYVPQEPMSNLDPNYTVGQQLMKPLRRVNKATRAEARKTALDLLRQVGIADPERIMRLYPHEISGGMAQRVLIAGAISLDPELLIADEPTTALDVTVQAEVLDVLRRLQRERNMAMLLVTHNFGVVADICDRVIVMRDGNTIEDGDVLDIFDHPKQEYTRMLLASTLDDAPPRPEWRPETKEAVA